MSHMIDSACTLHPMKNPRMLSSIPQGGDLRDALEADTDGALQWQRGGKRIALDVARGLTALHAVRVIHRDLKSKNVLLTGVSPISAKIADVGIAAIHTHGSLSATGDANVGTLDWSAPELLMGQRCAAQLPLVVDKNAACFPASPMFAGCMHMPSGVCARGNRGRAAQRWYAPPQVHGESGYLQPGRHTLGAGKWGGATPRVFRRPSAQRTVPSGGWRCMWRSLATPAFAHTRC